METTTLEEWSDVKGFEGLYKISTHARILSLSRWNVPKDKFRIPIKRGGYLVASLHRSGKKTRIQLARLVAGAFIPNLENKPQVNHIDGDKLNNHVSNLEWVTSKENHAHAWATGLHKAYGGKPVIQETVDGQFIASYPSVLIASQKTGYNKSSISRIANGHAKKGLHKGYRWRFPDPA